MSTRADQQRRGARRGGAESHPVESGSATLVRDPDRAGAWTLEVEGRVHSHVDLADPTALALDYVRRIGHVVDLAADAGLAIDAVHLGGGGLTLPRYVALTRPGSRQRVFENDTALTELVRRELPLDRAWRIRVGAADAREGLTGLKSGSADLVVADVFAASRTPAHLTSAEYLAEVARVLGAAGVYVANLLDGPRLRFARGQVATVRAAFPHVALIAAPGVLFGRRQGNLVVVGSATALPIVALAQRCAADPSPARVIAGEELVNFAASAKPVTDETATTSRSRDTAARGG